MVTGLAASPARGPPTDWHELAQAHNDRHVVQESLDDLPGTCIHSLRSATQPAGPTPDADMASAVREKRLTGRPFRGRF